MKRKNGIMTPQMENRREFSRVNAFVPFTFRVVPRTDINFLKARVLNDSFSTGFPVMPNPDDQIYGEWFKLINAKLDEIIRAMSFQQEGFSTLPFQKINISGSGMSFISDEPFEKGTIIEGKIVLTILNAIALYVYGEVVKIERIESGYSIGIRFINTDEIIRNEIIRFVFEKEREMIREKRGA